jgi:hypothetical protein
MIYSVYIEKWLWFMLDNNSNQNSPDIGLCKQLWPQATVVVVNGQEFFVPSSSKVNAVKGLVDLSALPVRAYVKGQDTTLSSIPIIGQIGANGEITEFDQSASTIAPANYIYLADRDDVIEVSPQAITLESIKSKVLASGIDTPDLSLDDIVLPGILKNLNEIVLSATGLDIYELSKAISDFTWRDLIYPDRYDLESVNIVQEVQNRREEHLINALQIDKSLARFIFGMIGNIYDEVQEEFLVLKDLTPPKITTKWKSDLAKISETQDKIITFAWQQFNESMRLGLPDQVMTYDELAAALGYKSGALIARNIKEADPELFLRRSLAANIRINGAEAHKRTTSCKYNGMDLPTWINYQYIRYKDGEFTLNDVQAIRELTATFHTHQSTIYDILNEDPELRNLQLEVASAKQSQAASETMARQRLGNGIMVGEQTYASVEEYFIAKLLENYIPGFKLNDGETYQVKVETAERKTKILDFVFEINGVKYALEFHPAWWSLVQGLDEEEYFKQREDCAAIISCEFIGVNSIDKAINAIEGVLGQKIIAEDKLASLCKQLRNRSSRANGIQIIDETMGALGLLTEKSDEQKVDISPLAMSFALEV